MLKNVGGWYPLIKTLIQKYDREAAMVYGVVWGFSNMGDEECWASQQTIAHEAGMSTQTVHRRLETLVADGYLKATPRLGDVTHYEPTSKIRVKVIFAQDTSDSQSAPPDSQSDLPLTNSQTIKRVNKITNITIPSGCSIDTPGEAYLFVKLGEVKKSQGRSFKPLWQNVAQREQFRAAEDKLGKDGLRNAIDRALRTNITALPRIVGYVVKMADVKKTNEPQVREGYV